MNNQKMSKSQKRKLRLIRRGENIAQKQIPVVNVKLPVLPPSQPLQQGKAARRRTARTKSTSPAKSGAGSMSYLQALLNPDRADGAKVPDEIGYPTATFQLEKTGTLSTGAGGDSVAIAMQPIIGGGTTYYPIYTYNGVAADSLGTKTNINWPNRSTAAGTFALFRPVSCMIDVSFIGNSTQDQGQLSVGCTWGGNVITAFPTAASGTFSLPGASIWPSKNGARVVWKPLDNTNFEFFTMTGSPDIYPYIWVCCTGLPQSTTGFMYRVVCNYEAVPNSETLSFIDVKPSPVNFKQIAEAFDWAQKAANNVRPLVGVIGSAVQMGRAFYGSSGNGGAVMARSSGLSPSIGLSYEPRYGALMRASKASSGAEGDSEVMDEGLEEDEVQDAAGDNNNSGSSSSSVQNPASLAVRSQFTPRSVGLTRTSSSGSIGELGRARK